MASGRAPRPPRPRKPSGKVTRIAAPKAPTGEHLGRALSDITKGLRPTARPAAIRRAPAASAPPSTIGQAARTRRVVAPARSAAELLEQTAPPDTFVPALTAADLFEQTADGAEAAPQLDRTETLSPTPSQDPDRPRALEARYNPDTQVLHVRYRNGGSYDYFDVPPNIWRNLKRNKSFGKTLDRAVIGVYAFEKVAF